MRLIQIVRSVVQVVWAYLVGSTAVSGVFEELGLDPTFARLIGVAATMAAVIMIGQGLAALAARYPLLRTFFDLFLTILNGANVAPSYPVADAAPMTETLSRHQIEWIVREHSKTLRTPTIALEPVESENWFEWSTGNEPAGDLEPPPG